MQERAMPATLFALGTTILTGFFKLLKNLCIGAKIVVPAFRAGKPDFTLAFGLASAAAAADFSENGFGVTLTGNFGIQADALHHLLHASLG